LDPGAIARFIARAAIDRNKGAVAAADGRAGAAAGAAETATAIASGTSNLTK